MTIRTWAFVLFVLHLHLCSLVRADEGLDSSIAGFETLSATDQGNVLSLLVAAASEDSEALLDPLRVSALGVLPAAIRESVIEAVAANVGHSTLRNLAVVTLLHDGEATSVTNGLYILEAIGASTDVGYALVAFVDSSLPVSVRAHAGDCAAGLSAALSKPVLQATALDGSNQPRLRARALGAAGECLVTLLQEEEVSPFALACISDLETDQHVLRAGLRLLPSGPLSILGGGLPSGGPPYRDAEIVAAMIASGVEPVRGMAASYLDMLVDPPAEFSFIVLGAIAADGSLEFQGFVEDRTDSTNFRIRIAAAAAAVANGWGGLVTAMCPEESHLITGD